MKRMLLTLGVLGLSVLGTREVRAQASGETMGYGTVSPGSRVVTYGERYVVRRKPFKTVIRERPARYMTTTPPVVRETRYFRPTPVIQRQVVQPPPMVETRLVQPAPVVQQRVIPMDPVIRTQYSTPYPY